VVRYKIGFKGRWVGGGVPGRRGRVGFGFGGDAVRRWFNMKDMFCNRENIVSKVLN